LRYENAYSQAKEQGQIFAFTSIIPPSSLKEKNSTELILPLKGQSSEIFISFFDIYG
jgi:hypothetical protein